MVSDVDMKDFTSPNLEKIWNWSTLMELELCAEFFFLIDNSLPILIKKFIALIDS